MTTLFAQTRSPITRVQFDPTNQEHLASMDQFNRTGNWGSIQFLAEWPFLDVPSTVTAKFVDHVRGVVRETELDRQKRFDANPNLIRFNTVRAQTKGPA